MVECSNNDVNDNNISSREGDSSSFYTVERRPRAPCKLNCLAVNLSCFSYNMCLVVVLACEKF